MSRQSLHHLFATNRLRRIEIGSAVFTTRASLDQELARRSAR